jgi:anti-sigma-K factor RskA
MDLDLGQSYLVVSERMDSAVAMGHNAPMPTKGMEYQLWLVMDDGGTHPGPTFMPDDDGEFMAMMHTGFEDAAAFTVTEEPMGGSQEPSGAPLTRVDL